MAVDKLTSNDILNIGVQDDIDSYPLRTNFTNLKNNMNELNDEIAAAAIGTTNAETTAARPYHDSLKNRLDDMWKAQHNYMINGGEVSASSPAAMTVEIAAGRAKVDGIDCKWSAATSGTITAPGSNTRYDVVVVNSDSTITVVTGAASADPVLPAIAQTQKPLAFLTLTSATATITASEITDCRDQGAYYLDDGIFKYKWKIQDAIDDISSGQIFIRNGSYYEQLVLTDKSNIELIGEASTKIYRISDASYCVLGNESSGGETTGNKLINLEFYGNSKAGSVELVNIDYSDNLTIANCYFDGNASSSATYKNFLLDYCDIVTLYGNRPTSSGAIDHSTRAITNSTGLREIETRLEITTTGANNVVLPPEVTNGTIELVGAGGGGAGSDTAKSGGGGGSGGYFRLENVAMSGTITITVGAKGTGGATATDGTDGGDTSYNDGSTNWIAGGGKKGVHAGAGGAGGALTNATTTLAGGAGGTEPGGDGTAGTHIMFGKSGGGGGGGRSGSAGTGGAGADMGGVGGGNGSNSGGGGGAGNGGTQGTDGSSAPDDATLIGSGGGGGGYRAAPPTSVVGADGTDGYATVTYTSYLV